MKFLGILLLLPFLFSATAKANVVDFNGSNVDMGTLQVGETGTISNNAADTTVGPYIFANGTDFGSLPSDAAITFTYTFSDMVGASLHSFGSYDYTANGKTYMGSSSAYTGQPTVTTAATNGISSAPLVFASANVNTALTSGTTTITNVSSSLAQIQSMFSGLFNSNGRLVSVSYNVSAVPLPAALPMFAAGLFGLLGLARYRKRHSL